MVRSFLLLSLIVLPCVGGGARNASAQVTRAGGTASETDEVPGLAVSMRPVSALRPGDVLEIRVWPDASLSGEFPVENTGYIYLPVIGAVQVTGLTLEELRAVLRESFAETMKSPVVTVTPRFRVTVMGGVSQPGLYTVDPTVTFWDLITMAGGFGDRSKTDEIRIFRDNDIYLFDATGAIETGNFAGSPILQSGDRILVPGGGFRLNFSQVTSVLQLVISALTLYQVLGN